MVARSHFYEHLVCFPLKFLNLPPPMLLLATAPRPALVHGILNEFRPDIYIGMFEIGRGLKKKKSKDWLHFKSMVPTLALLLFCESFLSCCSITSDFAVASVPLFWQ